MIKFVLFLAWHGAALVTRAQAIDAREAIELVTSDRETREELAAIVESESHGHAIGVHAKVNPRLRRRPGAAAWRRAVAAGWLSPKTCPAHALDVEDAEGEAWGPRGVAGQIAAYTLRRVAPCVAPRVLDVPIVAVRAALLQIEELRKTYRLRTREERLRAWRLGVGAARRAQANSQRPL